MAARTRPSPLVRVQNLGKCFPIFPNPRARLRYMLWGKKSKIPLFWALRGVDLEVWPGEVVGVVGRNGSGKSTLLRLICGTLAPTTGEVAVRARIAPMLTIGAGFNGDFSGRENAALSASLLGVDADQMPERMDWIRAFSDIGDFFDRPVKTYSSGMQARLAFAVAVSLDPDLIVIDEVLAVGDEAFSRKCIAQLEDMKARGAAILLVSHSANLVVELCDRVLVLDQGEAALTADAKEAVSKYQRLLYARETERAAVREALQTGADEAVGSDCGSASRIGATHSYDPGLRSESLVEFESVGARVTNPRFETVSGAPVNVLRSGEVYFYRYEVSFEAACCAVRFGMMLKLPTGVEVAGQVSHPLGRGIEWVEAGTRAEVAFPVRMGLSAGIYFANAGVVGAREEGEGYLHRIVDAVAFRVQAERDSVVTGSVDLRDGAGARFELLPPRRGGDAP